MGAHRDRDWLIGGGEIGALVRSTDWSASCLGPRKDWPEVLRTLVDLVVNTTFPTALLWGREWLLLYNDAYRTIAAAMPPQALGRSMRETWAKLWHIDDARLARVMDHGETVTASAATERASYTLCHSAVRTGGGTIAGMFVTLQETTPDDTLRERKALLRAISDESSDVIFAKDRDGRLRYANPATLALVGKPLDAVIGKTDAEFLDDADAARRVMDNDRVVMDRGIATELEEIVPRPDGTRRVWLSRKAPYRDRDGHVIGLLGISRDITDRKRAEEDERRAKKLLETTLDSITDGVVCLDREWRYTYFSETAAKLACVRREDTIGKCIWDVFPHTRGTQFAVGFHKAAETGQPVIFEEHYPPPIDKWLECNCSPSPDGLTVYFRDVTARRSADEALRKGDELLRAAITSLTAEREELRQSTERLELLGRATSLFMESKLDVHALHERLVGEFVPTYAQSAAVVLLSRDRKSIEVGTLRHAAPGARELLLDILKDAALPERPDLSPAEVELGHARLLTHVAPGALERESSPRLRDFFARHPVGSLLAIPLRTSRGVLGALRLARAPEDPPFTTRDQALFQDIADRAALALDAALRFADAEQAIRLRDDFLSIASHELRTPLTALQLQLQSMRHLLTKGEAAIGSARFTNKVESANRQTERLIALVEDLLDVSHLSLGYLQLHREELDLAEVAWEVVERHASQAAAAGCVLDLSTVAVHGQWDRLRIEQVLTNLVANAIKYGAGKPVDIRVKAEGDMARLSIRDQGIGIERTNLARIFGRFERAVSGHNYGGLGLGLYISKQIVEAHGGIIRVESDLGHGAAFHVMLPTTAPA